MSGIIGLISVSAAVPGASEVKSIRHSNSGGTARETMITPASGKKIRIVATLVGSNNNSVTDTEVYFGDGANISSTPANAIHEAHKEYQNHTVSVAVFPDGGGPVGAVDAVVSLRNNTGTDDLARAVVHWREE